MAKTVPLVVKVEGLPEVKAYVDHLLDLLSDAHQMLLADEPYDPHPWCDEVMELLLDRHRARTSPAPITSSLSEPSGEQAREGEQ